MGSPIGVVLAATVISGVLLVATGRLGSSTRRRPTARVCEESVQGFADHLSLQPATPLVAWCLQSDTRRTRMGRGILLWLLGVPIPIIILLAIFYHH